VRLTLERLSLPLVDPFTIARSSTRTTESVVVRLAADGLHAIGESAPSERYGETAESVIATLESRRLPEDPYAREAALRGLPPAASCALDIALHDLLGQRARLPIWRMLGLDRDIAPVTSFTIGIDTPERMLGKLARIGDHPVLKVKLGFPEELEVVAAIRDRYTGTLRLDANEAWTPEESVAKLRALERYDVEFCEQPIPAGSPERLRWISERTTIPLVADEDARTASDLPALAGAVAGVNLKLVKTGGLAGALAAIATARALGLKVMIGCMVESAICTTAAAQISPLADWADLDGPFLTAHDPFSGVTYDRGRLVLPDSPGLGIVEAP